MGLGSKRGTRHSMGLRPRGPEGNRQWEVREEGKGHWGGR